MTTGRRAPLDTYQLAKQIDGHPGREWTYAVFNSRAEALRSAEAVTLFYEPLSTLDQMVNAMAVNLDQLHSGSTPDVLHRLRLGLKWHRSGFYAPNGRLPPLGECDEFVGLHMADVVSLEVSATSGPTLVFVNRWNGWGDDRKGYLGARDFDDYVAEIWVNRPSTSGPSPAQARDMARAVYGRLSDRLAAVRHAWVEKRPISSKAVIVADRAHMLYRIQVSSLRTGRTVRIIELRHEVFGGVGRAHVHVGGEQPAELEELFVWPEYRRRGYGTFLFHQAIEAATYGGHREVTAPIYDADLLSVWGPAAKAFLSKQGFVIRIVQEERPSCQRRGDLKL